MKTAIVLGATGLIGHHLVSLLAKQNHIEKVIAVARRPMHFEHFKVIPIKLNKWSIMAAGKMRSNKAKIYISSCSTMKIFNDVNAYFNSQEWEV